MRIICGTCWPPEAFFSFDGGGVSTCRDGRRSTVGQGFSGLALPGEEPGLPAFLLTS
jgi:hypothetical protein